MEISFKEYLKGVLEFTSNVKEKYSRKRLMKFFSFSRNEINEIKEKIKYITSLENFLVEKLFEGRYMNYDISTFLKTVNYVLDEVHKLSFTEPWYRDVIESYLITDEFIRKLTIFFEQKGNMSIVDYINTFGRTIEVSEWWSSKR